MRNSPTREAPTITKAQAFLRDLLRNDYAAAGSILPSLPHLANTAGVSRSSMWKAVGLLKKEGSLSVRKGGRIHAGSDPYPTRPGLSARNPLWQRTRTLLERELLAGIFASRKRLPSLKELQARYGVCFVTLRKALDSLVGDGILIPNRKAYLVQPAPARPSQKHVILFTGRIIEGQVSVLLQRGLQLIGALETACAQTGISVKLVRIRLGDPNAYTDAVQFVSQSESTLGYILDVLPVFAPTETEELVRIVSAMAQSKKPVAILDEHGAFELPALLARRDNVRIFRIAARAAGRKIARMLLGLGHERIAFISMLHRMPWSVKRYQGLVDQFDRLGLRENVRLFALDSFEDVNEIFVAISGWDSDLARRILLPLNITQDVEHVIRQAGLIRNTASIPMLPEKMHLEIREQLRTLASMVDGAAPVLLAQFRENVFAWAKKKLLEAYCAPLFEAALADRAITGWVCVNDDTALAALRFLKSAGVGVPARLSVVGFDNIPESLENQLMSFDFDHQGITHQMLLFLNRSPLSILSRGTAPVEIDGMPIERPSVARVVPAEYGYRP